MKFKDWIKTERDEHLPSILKALKEAGRIILIAIIPLVIDGLNRNAINVRAIIILAAITFLRFVDKLLHEEGKLRKNETLKEGLTRF